MSNVSLNPLELTGRAATHIREAPESGARLHADGLDAVNALREASARAGHDLAIVSSFRDFARQSAIWNRKFRGEQAVFDRAGRPLEVASMSGPERVRAILIWSALPGASRHHWGSEVDVLDAAALGPGERAQMIAQEYEPGGRFERLSGWLDSNMRRFGFFRPYATWQGGVRPEPWHLSYAPVSVPALQVLSLEVLREAIEGADMPGKHAVLARLPELYQRYVLAVDAP